MSFKSINHCLIELYMRYRDRYKCIFFAVNQALQSHLQIVKDSQVYELEELVFQVIVRVIIAIFMYFDSL